MGDEFENYEEKENFMENIYKLIERFMAKKVLALPREQEAIQVIDLMVEYYLKVFDLDEKELFQKSTVFQRHAKDIDDYWKEGEAARFVEENKNNNQN